ncbi:MAG: methionyl-tRNA formyltransferase [Candidatus Midichloria sp.]|nr:MAG: methionyl-tRNA formyltransferase [Candidatus Midichloria sp.]
MKIIFMGTPKFAVPALTKLLESPDFKVVGVYTKPLKASGYSMNLVKSPIHILAEAHNIPVITPRTLREIEVLNKLKSFAADIIAVAAYGLILPSSVLEATKYGCINIHPSDLPRWRGAAPIQRTIMAGDKQTALCIMQMDEGLDTGDVILRHRIKVPENITAAELENIMANLGADKLLETLLLIKNNNATFEKQKEEGITHANKIDRSEEKINWQKSATEIIAQIHTFSPYPGAYFIYNNEIIKIIDAVYINNLNNNQPTEVAPGLVIDNNLTISCSSEFIRPTLLQRQGRKIIYTDAFLRGFPIPKGAKVE